jgi:hypothetical protein
VLYAGQVHGRTALPQHRLGRCACPRETVPPSRLEAILHEHHPRRWLRTSARRRHLAVRPDRSLLAAGPPPGAKPPIAGPDRLILHGEDLPLPAEVIPASAVGAFWVYRRGARIFTCPLGDITRYWHGIPFLAPEVVLLIKARPGLDKPGRENDQRDFEAALPMLGAAQRSWLKDAIERQSWLKDAIDRQPRLDEALEPQPRPPGQHRWAAELATDPPRPA